MGIHDRLRNQATGIMGLLAKGLKLTDIGPLKDTYLPYEYRSPGSKLTVVKTETGALLTIEEYTPYGDPEPRTIELPDEEILRILRL